jgi:hypothetical protein
MDHAKYWAKRFVQEKNSSSATELESDKLARIFVSFLAEIHTDYTKKCDLYGEQIIQLAERQQLNTNAITEVGNAMGEALEDITDAQFNYRIGNVEMELTSLHSKLSEPRFSAHPDQLKPLPKASGSTPEPTPPPPPPPPPPPAAQKPPPVNTWAQVARKGKKKTPAPPAKPAQAAAPSPATPKAPSPKKGLTLRERRLTIKRDGTPLTTTNIAIRDSVNTALQATLIQRVERNAVHDLLITTMDTVKATSLNSKISQFLHLIPGTTTSHLDAPSAQLLVHNIPTSYSLADIGREISTFNTGLVLAEQPRWLRTPEMRQGKLASTVVISITGPRAQDFAEQPRLCAFSTTYRLERRLRFNKSTQCYNCHKFGHHTLKCTNPASCRWCAQPHSTGDHTCPTATCTTRGRLCAHSSPMCANCDGPHEAHSTTCTKRPTRDPSGGEGEDDHVSMVGT